ncbi:histidine kinase [Larkinella sp. GY13]|jgi:two-component sensor histidine kinase|uniref:histidine kinase n=1 Tax=Larkinella sp. GY13 TaxID=3453720 RepID=UPI003EED0AB7
MRGNRKQHWALALIWLTWLVAASSWAQNGPILRGDSWAEVRKRRGGVVTVVWDQVEPFAYRDSTGRLAGIEVELLENFRQFVKRRYGFELTLHWVYGGGFIQTYNRVRTSPQPGVFGLGNFSVTPDRQREVQFTPPYMPDLSVLITHPSAPNYASARDFITALPNLRAYTMRHTTMAQDIDSLRRGFYPTLPVTTVNNDLTVMRHVIHHPNAFSYMPLSLYLLGRKRGLPVKRQTVLMSERPGYAAIYPLKSDWGEPMRAYADAPGAQNITNQIIRKYLSESEFGLAFETSERPSNYDFERLSLQKELVTQRLINTALEVQTQKTYRSLALLSIGLLLIVAGILYVRSASKQRINQQLKAQYDRIQQQNAEIDHYNRKLKLKVLQAQINPHFIFNSLNAIQYFIMLNEKRKSLAYITSFARFMRLLLANASQTYASVNQEMLMLDQYLALEKTRFSNKFEYRVKLANSASLAEMVIPSLIVHPFVENALYYGILNRPDGAGFIDIRFDQTPAGVRVEVTDNGIGRSEALTISQRKQGSDLTPHWQTVKDRLALLNEQNEQKIRFETVDLTDSDGRAAGTQVTLYFPAPATESCI